MRVVPAGRVEKIKNKNKIMFKKNNVDPQNILFWAKNSSANTRATNFLNDREFPDDEANLC